MEPTDTNFFEIPPDTTYTPKTAIYQNIEPSGKQAQRIIYWGHVCENSTTFVSKQKKKKNIYIYIYIYIYIQATSIISDTWNLLVDKTRFSPKFK